MFNCPYCSEYSGNTFQKLLRHIKFIHSNEPNFSMTCGHCNQTFTKFASYKSHIRRKHKDVGLMEAVDIENDENRQCDEEQENEETGLQFIENMTRFIALFMLKTKEENQLSQNVMNSIIHNTEDLVEQSLESLKSEVRSCLTRSGIDISTIEGLNEVLQQPSTFSQAINPLTNEYQQAKYFMEHFHFVVPETVVLSQHTECQTINGRHKIKTIQKTFQYIPVLKTLAALLNEPNVLEEVYNCHASTDETLKDFCDGEDFKQHDMFGENQNALVLHCYFDEFEVANPLGSKARKHKLGAFYFTLGNIRPCYRSSMNVIQLFALCKVPLIKNYWIDRILQPFMKDLSILEADTGVAITIDGNDRMFRGSIGLFSGDNLGSHLIGGFTESFSALRICRVCMATSDDIQTKFNEEDFQLRTKESHERYCQLVTEDPSLSSAYGRYFNVIGGLDLDVMHDQLEGVLPLEIKMFLRQCIQVDRIITIELLNERISEFNYGPADSKNKPSPLKQQVVNSDTASISQSAAQMWCLARMFPLLVGDLIQPDDSRWENLLRLLQIEEIVFAPKTTAELAAYLVVLIEDNLEQFSQNYDRRLIPKQHYMVHYPGQIIRRGPLVRSWAMRFEAKHKYFKGMVDKINNFKNIDLSLARRHQALQAYLLQQSGGNIFKKSLELGPGKKNTVAELPAIVEQELLQELDEEVTRETTLTVSSWVIVSGTKYVKGCVIIVGLDHGQPMFGKVCKIMTLMAINKVIFQYETLQVCQYVQHLNAYEVNNLQDVKFIDYDRLQDFHPLGSHHGFGSNANKLFVVLRYRVDLML